MKSPIETGWTSRFSHGCRIRQEELLDCVMQLATRRDELKVDWILVDDGWQSALGDWTGCNSKFPGGLSLLAKQIHELGFRMALWMAPFLAEQGSGIAEEHPEWLIRDKSGLPDFSVPWRDTGFSAILDVSLPDVRNHLKTTCEFLKKTGVDRLVIEPYSAEIPAESLEKGLSAIREIFPSEQITLCGENRVTLSPAEPMQILNGTCGILPADAPENILLAAGLMAKTVVIGGNPDKLGKDTLLHCADFLEMRGKYKKIRRLKTPPGSWSGVFQNLVFQEQVYAFFNLREQKTRITIPCSAPLSRFFSIEEYHPVNGMVTIPLDGNEAMLCAIESE